MKTTYKDVRHALWNRHKQNALKRGVAWEFSKEDFIAWWERHLGPDWMKKRGAGKGKYVMARNGDKGSYRPDNVRCILFEDNCKERKANGTAKCGDNKGERNPKAKLTDEKVRYIRKSDKSVKELMAELSVSQATIYQVRRYRIWTHV